MQEVIGGEMNRLLTGEECRKAKREDRVLLAQDLKTCAETLRECGKWLETKKHKPTLYHYLCYGSGTCLLVDTWGKTEYADCRFRGGRDFCCKPGPCPINGRIQGLLELDQRERWENRLIDDISMELRQGIPPWEVTP